MIAAWAVQNYSLYMTKSAACVHPVTLQDGKLWSIGDNASTQIVEIVGLVHP